MDNLTSSYKMTKTGMHAFNLVAETSTSINSLLSLLLS